MSPEEWFDRLSAALPDAAGLNVTVQEREALLDLARVAAHTSERWVAPISTFLAGVALGAAPPRERLRVIQQVVAELQAFAGDDAPDAG